MEERIKSALDQLAREYFSGDDRKVLEDSRDKIKIVPLDNGAFTVWYGEHNVLKAVSGVIYPGESQGCPYLYMDMAQYLQDKFGCVISDGCFIDRIGNVSIKDMKTYFPSKDAAMAYLKCEINSIISENGYSIDAVEIDEEKAEATLTDSDGEKYCSWAILPAKRLSAKDELRRMIDRAYDGLLLYAYDLQDTWDCGYFLQEAKGLIDEIGNTERVRNARSRLMAGGYKPEEADGILKIVMKELFEKEAS